MESITVRIGIPARSLSPNARVHWAKKARARKCQRISAAMSASFVMTGDKWPWTNATIEPRVFWPTRRVVDGDNMLAMLKGAIDGLVDAGLLADDKGVKFLPCVMGYSKEDPRVELVVTLADVAA